MTDSTEQALATAPAIDVPDQGHAMLSASGSERWENCPGSVAMEHGLPDNASEYADEGTAAHTLMALTFADPERRAHEFLGRYIQVCDSEGKFCRGFTVDHEMADHVQKFVRDTLVAVGEEGTLLVEQRVPLQQITEEHNATGQADVVAILDEGREIMARDLKFGMGVKVRVRNHQGKLNSQLVMYADGAIEKFDGLVGKAERVRLVIQQPRLDHTDEEVVTLAELKARVAELRKAADLAMTAFTFRDNWLRKGPDDQQYLVPGDEQCRFCKAKANCGKFSQFVNNAIAGDFELVEINGERDMAPVIRHTMVPETLSQKMLTVDLVEDWCRAVRAEVERRLSNGIPVPEFKLVQGKRGNRQWRDDVEAETLLKSMRLKSDEMYKQTLQSPTQIEKVLKESPRKWKKVAPLITQNDGKTHVAHVSDPRPEVQVGATADDFRDLTQPQQEGEHADLT